MKVVGSSSAVLELRLQLGCVSICVSVCNGVRVGDSGRRLIWGDVGVVCRY